MSLRPPAQYWIRVTGTGAGNSSDATRFTLAASGDSPVPGTIGNLSLQGVYFESGANGLNFIATPQTLPPGVTGPQNVTEPVPAPSFLEKLPATINASTTAFPFQLWYGGLGPEGR